MVYIHCIRATMAGGANRCVPNAAQEVEEQSKWKYYHGNKCVLRVYCIFLTRLGQQGDRRQASAGPGQRSSWHKVIGSLLQRRIIRRLLIGSRRCCPATIPSVHVGGRSSLRGSLPSLPGPSGPCPTRVLGVVKGATGGLSAGARRLPGCARARRLDASHRRRQWR